MASGGNTNSTLGAHKWQTLSLTTVIVLAGLWARTATKFVPEPYLDEVFHIPQAQKYCEGRYAEWDDKITTPPGLYLLSLTFTRLTDCGTANLRMFNTIALSAMAALALLCRQRIEVLLAKDTVPPTKGNASIYAIHTAFNIALCPVIFFFSGLYYTDVASTAAVLAAFVHSLDRMSTSTSSLWSDMISIALGVLALFMRQTNVFWVVVCFGALEAVHAVKTLLPPKANKIQGSGLGGFIKHHLQRYSLGDVHDPPLHSTWPDDMVLAATSLLFAAAANPLRVVRQIWPHLAVLGLFVTFVFYNGGVVLGDKSNHVATIHLAQMLYLWPFFAFFSLPLLIPQALKPAMSIYGILHTKRTVESTAQATWIKTTSSVVFFLVSFALSLVIVKYNTIIHPFTLADNRHYMFYIFRYTIRRARWIAFALVVPYTASRWLVWNALSGSPTAALVRTKRKETELYGTTEPVAASTALIWLLATTLSLITAPLVEPRYFIIPWVIWRLMLPAWRAPSSMTESLGEDSFVRKALAMTEKYNLVLWLETAWFVIVNVGTMYIFLTKPYQWKAEDGTLLDNGRWQRFMW